jgi:hypothetical protein
MSKYWVGKVGRTVFVFDVEIQPQSSNEVTLFSGLYDRPVKLEKNIVRARISKAALDSDASEALARYNNWKQFYRSELTKINSSPAFKTTEFLDKSQSKTRAGSLNRKANCYNCKSDLIGKRGNVCEKCFWIACKCGACGCGYSNRNSINAGYASYDQSASGPDGYQDPDARKDSDFEEQQIRDEARDWSESVVRSNDEGWFYSEE